MSRKRTIASAFWVLLLGGASLARADAVAPVYAQPLGVYAKIDIEDAIATKCAKSSDHHSCLRRLYQQLFMNPVISGLTVGEHWDNIQLSSADCYKTADPKLCVQAGTDWTYLDDAFAAANAAGKSVQLIITPGVDTPPWVLAQIDSCDPLFPSGTGPAPPDCGKVTFSHFQQEKQRADGDVFPLPWHHFYRTQWNSFLQLLNDRYNNVLTNPAFVSIAVARPNGASDEMILPTSAYHATASGVAADKAWKYLIQHSFPNAGPDYWNSDQAFVDAWTQTIDDYEKIFSGLTLVLSPDAGNYLPELPTTILDQPLYNIECANAANAGGPQDPYSCAAKTNILSYFLHEGGPNAKVARVGGMTSASSLTVMGGTLGIGVAGMKLLSLQAPPLLGAAEFDHPVTGKQITTQKEGCTNGPPNCTPEEAAYNVLSVFFGGTPAASYFGGTMGVGAGTCGSELVQYLEVPYLDILNALTLPPPNKPSSIPGLGTTSLEMLLMRASQDLSAIVAVPPPTCNLTIVAAVLPLSRSVEIGNTATAFATMIDAGPADASTCTIAPQTGIPASFVFQTTDPTTNAVTGTANTPANIAAGKSQSFVIGLTPTAAFPPTDVAFTLGCANALAMTTVGVDTLNLSASATPVPDIVALAASSDPGYVDIPGATGTGDFAVATVNLGSDATITAVANTGAATLPVTLALCQTNPASGACLASPAINVTTTIAANATSTFGIFVTGSASVPDLPGVNRVFVQFTDPGGVLRGETSVAVRTQ
jgi:hypothetical protein